MANSRFEYVKGFEQDDRLLPGCWIVVRLDGKAFTKFSERHGFAKPNDARALELMDACAKAVMHEFGDVCIAYGESDEFSFVFHKGTTLYGRRASKLVSLVASCFTGHYVQRWPDHFPATPLQQAPLFDGRAVCYPTDQTLRDYLAWRQADTHVNNQYNTCFWALVHAGMAPAEAQQALKGTLAEHKNELLFTRFGTNYAQLPERFRKGSVLIWQKCQVAVKEAADGTPVFRQRRVPVVLHEDIIRDEFWEKHPQVLGGDS